MGDSRGEAGGRDGEDSFILVFSFLAMRFQQPRVHILFSFVLFCILILQVFDIVVSLQVQTQQQFSLLVAGPVLQNLYHYSLY